MGSTLEENLKTLSFTNSELVKSLNALSSDVWKFCNSAKGEPNFYKEKDGKRFYLHSKENIAIEARQWFSMHDLTDVDWLIVYGIGLGFYYKELKSWLKSSLNHHLIFIEDDLEVIKHFLETEDANEILKDSQVELHYLETQDRSSQGVVKDLIQKFTYQSVRFASLISYEKEKASEFSSFKHFLELQLFRYQTNVGEYLERGASFFSNFYKNLFQYPESLNGNKFVGKFKNIPAIICGAGPSLEKNVEVLRQLKDKALIFAGGTAMNALNAFGINPHFGFGVDPFPAQFTRLLMNTAFETPFFYRNRMNFHGAQMIHGPKLYYPGATGYPLAKWFDDQLGLSTPALDEGCNVINMSLSIAKELGCNPIICVGVDLAYSSGKSYSPGIEMSAIHDPKEHLITKTPQEELILKNDIYGEPVFTLWKWMSESAWFSYFTVLNPDITLINSTEGGIGFAKVPNIPLQTVSDLFLEQQYDFDALLHAAVLDAFIPDITAAKIYPVLEVFTQSLQRCMEILRDIHKEDPENWSKKDNYNDEKVQTLEHSFKEELAYKELLEVFDDNYQKYVKSSLENSQNPALLLNHLPGRFPYLMEICIQNIKFIEEALAKEISRKKFKQVSYQAVSSNLHQNYHQGLLTGPSLVKDKEGKILIESLYEKGKKVGVSQAFYPDGQLYAKRNYQEGLEEGLQLYYYPNGQLKTSLPYERGVLEGKVSLYFPDGSLKRQVQYKKGKKDGLDVIYSDTGTLEMQAEYIQGVPTGTARQWYGNGVLAKEVTYAKPGEIATLQQFSPNGVPILEPASIPSYFDQVFRESDKLQKAISSVVKNLEDILKVMDAEGSSGGKELQNLKKQLVEFKALADKLQKGEGAEPIWQTPNAKKALQEYVEIMSGSMGESIVQIVEEFNILKNRIQKKKEDINNK